MNYVLMSTYNGTKFVRAQLDSIIAQDWHGPCSVIIRDDGSSDSTVQELRAIKVSCMNPLVDISVIRGVNIGPIESFHQLCRSIDPSDDDLVYFSDQDDVWTPRRVERVNSVFKNKSDLEVYCGALKLVDEKLCEIGTLNHLALLGRKNVFPVLVNHITGCSLCIRGRAFSKLNFHIKADCVPMHDWWIAIQSYFYSLPSFYDNFPSVLYRQHGGNVVGISSNLSKILSPDYWRNKLSGNLRIHQISCLDENHITDRRLLLEKEFILKNFDSFWGRWRMAIAYYSKGSLFRWLLFIILK